MPGDHVHRQRTLPTPPRLGAEPNLSQPQLATEPGYRLGKFDYCLRALKDKGWVKAENFRNSQNKSAYFYKLTPAGMSEKVRVTQRFLQRKLEEHEQIKQEIERLKVEVAAQKSHYTNRANLSLL